jgi:hypothetical protein
MKITSPTRVQVGGSDIKANLIGKAKVITIENLNLLAKFKSYMVMKNSHFLRIE